MSKIITNQFAEDLGYTYGGCIRDLVRFTAREAARVSKAKLPLSMVTVQLYSPSDTIELFLSGK